MLQSISQCRRLKALYLTSNPLPAFPKAILVIRALQQLRLSDTLMTGLPPEMAVLTNLKELAIENNALVWPPPEVKSTSQPQTLNARLARMRNRLVFWTFVQNLWTCPSKPLTLSLAS